MGKIHFTLQDIKYFLKDEFALDWNGKVMKDFDTKQFVKASINDFDISGGFMPTFLLRSNGKKVIRSIAIGNVRFTLYNEKTGEKSDKSEEWKVFLVKRQEQGLNK